MIRVLTFLTIITFTIFAQTFNVATTPELRTALETAATNGEDDTITLADGTYKTTDDGGGTFVYVSNEANKLTLQGSSSENVILSGNSTHQIMDATYIHNGQILYLNNLNIVDANTTDYAIKSSQGINVKNCVFSNNKSGFYSWKYAYVEKSSFLNNSSKGFHADSCCGGPNVTVNNSIFKDNGYGFYTYYYAYTIVNNSIFLNNTFFAIHSTNFRVSNSLFANNGIYINDVGSAVDSNTKIVNSIFLLNDKNINGSEQSVVTITNSYLDESKVLSTSFYENNIFNGINIGFVDEANGDYNLATSSDLIDVGTTTIEGITFPTTDYNGNARVAGSSIDIGPYEFSSTRPTLSNFTYMGIAKELSQLTFSVNYTLADGRSVDKVEYDYTNDGSWTTTNTHTFNTAGTYTVNVKVTDSEGEFSSTSLSLTVVPLPYEDMTDEQKLLKAIDPIYYDDIVAIIDAEKSSSNISGVTTGENNVVLDPNLYGLHTQEELNTAINDTNTSAYEVGKQYVLSNLSEFDLFTLAEKLLAESNGEATGKTYVQSNPSEFNLVTKTASDAAVTSATATGNKYVQDNLAEFALTTVAEKDTAVNDANTTGYNLGASEKETSILKTPLEYGLVSKDDLNASVADAISNGLTQGKQYVQDNLSEFDLVSKPTIEVSPTTLSSLDTGWTLASTPFEIIDLSVFDNVNLVWIFDAKTASWSAYSSDADTMAAINSTDSIGAISTIPAGSGVWVLK